MLDITKQLINMSQDKTAFSGVGQKDDSIPTIISLDWCVYPEEMQLLFIYKWKANITQLLHKVKIWEWQPPSQKEDYDK